MSSYRFLLFIWVGVALVGCGDDSASAKQAATESDGGKEDTKPRASDADGGHAASAGGHASSKPNSSASDAGPEPVDKRDEPTRDGATPAPEDSDQDDAGSSDSASVAAGDIDKLDLLFVVDNSNSMTEEQEALKREFPAFIEALTTGERFSGDPQPFPPAKDIHVGVISTDMGTPGFDFGSGSQCMGDGGDDGRLQHAPHGPGCDASYPLFLSYSANAGTDRAKFANDFGCIAALGTGGCGFEQQLEAPLKALWPSQYVDAQGKLVTPNPISFLATTIGGTTGRGDLPEAQGGNLGFLRNDRAQGQSLIAIVVVTDEEDCSSRTSEHLRPSSQLPNDSPYRTQDINLRCFSNPQLLYDVQNRYVRGLRELRPGNEQLVVFAAVAGVPAELVTTEALAAVDFSDEGARNAYYDSILNHPSMQEVIDPTTNPGVGTGNLRPSCSRPGPNGMPATAYPPRRIVQLAQGFGEQGIIQSICQDDLRPAMRNILDLIARRQAARAKP